MLRSMTGYGRGEATIGGRRIVFEIKSVNHKFFEFNSRITRGYLFLEDKLKAYVQGKISRGKVDVFLQIETLEETDVQVLVNHSLASAYVKALEELQPMLYPQSEDDAEQAKENSDRAAEAARESEATEKTDEETLQEITK